MEQLQEVRLYVFSLQGRRYNILTCSSTRSLAKYRVSYGIVNEVLQIKGRLQHTVT